MQAAEDFLEVVLDAHISVAATTIMEPDMSLGQLSDKVVEKYIHLIDCKSSKDRVHTYACELMTLGLLWRNYYDSVREGDGMRVLCIWKYLLLVFKAKKRHNYCKEAAILLFQFHYVLSDRLRMQLMTSRFINTKGRVGCNMPSDLYMEHLNRRLKQIIRHQGSNIQPTSLLTASKVIGIVDSICRSFEDQVHGRQVSDVHRKPSTNKDFDKIKEELIAKQVFKIIDNRRHFFFKFEKCVLESIDYEVVKDYLIDKILPKFLY